MHRSLRTSTRQVPATPLLRTLAFSQHRAISSTTQDESQAAERRYAHHLQRCAQTYDLSSGRSLHAAITKQPTSLFLQNHVLNMYFKCGDVPSALHMFDEMPQRNVVSWSATISGLVHCGYPAKSISFYRLMSTTVDLRPNEFTLVSALNACALMEQHTVALQVYAQVVKLGFISNVFLTNAFLAALIRTGELADAVALFESRSNRDVVSWNSILAGLSRLACSHVWQFWCRMMHEGFVPDEFTFSTVLTGLAEAASLGSGLQVHAQLVKFGYGSESRVGNSLLDMYLKNLKLSDGLRAFEELPTKDVVSWTQMATGFLHCGQPARALELLKEMMRGGGVTPNRFAMATAFSACSSLSCLEEGAKAHALRVKLGGDADACADNALLDMYAKCGCMDAAFRVFRSMEERSSVSWTAMIMGFAQNGMALEALRVYVEMMLLAGVQPNSVTFVCVLYACSQGGLVEEGWRHFSSMESDYGVAPEEDHYVCMVDLLGRAGHIARAKSLVESMPFKTGALVWRTLLGACRMHGDVVVGKFAAEQALTRDPRDSSTYALLQNIYAGARRWDGAIGVGDMIRDGEVERVAGRSWIEVMELK